MTIAVGGVATSLGDVVVGDADEVVVVPQADATCRRRPGGRSEEMTRRHRREHGIPLPADLVDEIRAIRGRHGVSFILGTA